MSSNARTIHATASSSTPPGSAERHWPAAHTVHYRFNATLDSTPDVPQSPTTDDTDTGRPGPSSTGGEPVPPADPGVAVLVTQAPGPPGAAGIATAAGVDGPEHPCAVLELSEAGDEDRKDGAEEPLALLTGTALLSASLRGFDSVSRAIEALSRDHAGDDAVREALSPDQLRLLEQANADARDGRLQDAERARADLRSRLGEDRYRRLLGSLSDGLAAEQASSGGAADLGAAAPQMDTGTAGSGPVSGEPFTPESIFHTPSGPGGLRAGPPRHHDGQAPETSGGRPLPHGLGDLFDDRPAG